MCIRDRGQYIRGLHNLPGLVGPIVLGVGDHSGNIGVTQGCLLYTSDAADERSSVDLGGRRIIKKKNQREHTVEWRSCIHTNT